MKNILLEMAKASDFGMNDEQYGRAKKNLLSISVSINDYNRLKARAKKVGVETFMQFIALGRKAKQEGVSLDDYLDDMLAGKREKFSQEVKQELNNTQTSDEETTLGSNIKAKADAIKKSLRSGGTSGSVIPIASRFLIKTKERLLEIIGNAVNSHAYRKEVPQEQQKELDKEAAVKDPDNWRRYAEKARERASQPIEVLHKTRTNDYSVSDHMITIRIGNQEPQKAYILTIGQGQKKGSKIGTGKEETEVDIINAFIEKQAEYNKISYSDQVDRFVNQYLGTNRKANTLSAFQKQGGEFKEAGFNEYMMKIIQGRKLDPIYNKADNTYYIIPELKKILKPETKTPDQPKEQPMVQTKIKKENWMTDKKDTYLIALGKYKDSKKGLAKMLSKVGMTWEQLAKEWEAKNPSLIKNLSSKDQEIKRSAMEKQKRYIVEKVLKAAGYNEKSESFKDSMEYYSMLEPIKEKVYIPNKDEDEGSWFDTDSGKTFLAYIKKKGWSQDSMEYRRMLRFWKNKYLDNFGPNGKIQEKVKGKK